MTKYIIESKGRRRWVLRRRSRYETLASATTLMSIREQTFVRLRVYAPCSFSVLGDPPEEWRVESADGEWEQVEP